MKNLPFLGQLVRVVSDIDRYPQCAIPAGAVGIVVESNCHMVSVFFDRQIAGLHATEWNNCLCLALSHDPSEADILRDQLQSLL